MQDGKTTLIDKYDITKILTPGDLVDTVVVRQNGEDIIVRKFRFNYY